MPPRLVAIEGPLTGQAFDLEDPEIGIGRGKTNRIIIPDLSISRKHCLIHKTADGMAIRDCGSMHGTRINGLAITFHRLFHGDRLALGMSTFLYVHGNTDPVDDNVSLKVSDVDVSGRSTVHLKPCDARYLLQRKGKDAASEPERTARDLGALVRLSSAIGRIRGVRALSRCLLDLLFDMVPAGRGGILLVHGTAEGESGPGTMLTAARGVSGDGSLEISRTAVERALRDRVAVLSGLTGTGETSTPSSGSTSFLCVPLAVFDQAVGLVYLESEVTAEPFDESHLQLVTAAADMAAAPVENARRLERFEKENQRLKAEASVEHNMLGRSPAMFAVFRQLDRLAPTDSTVLILGESGTGKELAAHAIHRGSHRAGMPFVALNCAVLSELLLESELFGHEKGAFTGACARKVGKLELADEGTIFLDEVGEMPSPIQAKLLRVLEEREFYRVGGTRPVRVNVRFLAATNRDLQCAVEEGRFRRDLFYRLNVITLTMPPLRERREDILPLAGHFVALYAGKLSKPVEGFSAAAEQCLLSYGWPGNVRELRNAMERAIVLGADRLLGPEDLPEALIETRPAGGSTGAGYHEAVNEAKRAVIRRALDETGGVITEAARKLGLNPNYLHRLLNNLDLR